MVKMASSAQVRPSRSRLLYTLLLVYILLAAAYLRFEGIYWGEYQYLHPDERFLVMVGSDISPVKSLAEYWDTANSSLNPNNRGYGFYVYGTLPMFLTRYLVEWLYGHSGLDVMTNVGRVLSALADLGTVLFVYLTAKRVFDERVGLLAAAFSAFSVLQIQQSHFFTMDTFTTFFAMITIYLAVVVALGRSSERESDSLGSGQNAMIASVPGNEDQELRGVFGIKRFIGHPLFKPSVGFGLALGMAMASKINAAPLALLLPVAMLIRLTNEPGARQRDRAQEAVIYLVAAALTSVLIFRIFQPYAFSGPGVLGLRLNQVWLGNLRSLQEQLKGDLGFPPNLQWVNRPVWFAWQNMVLWGLGLPLGLLAWVGFLWSAWRMVSSWRKHTTEWGHHILLWGWTGFYFTWQSLPNNPTMRYQLLVYPTLAIFAAWSVIKLYDRAWTKTIADESAPSISENQDGDTSRRPAFLKGRWSRLLAFSVGGFVLITTAAYSLSFDSIYTHPITRIAASRWIYQNIPGALNLQIDTGKGLYNQPLPFAKGYSLTPGQPFSATFTAKSDGNLAEIYLPHIGASGNGANPVDLMLTVSSGSNNEQPLGKASIIVNPALGDPPDSQDYLLTLEQPVPLEKDQSYSLSMQLPKGQTGVDMCGPLIAQIATPSGLVYQTIPNPPQCVIRSGLPYYMSFTAKEGGELSEILLANVKDLEANSENTSLQVTITPISQEMPQGSLDLTAELVSEGNLQGAGYMMRFEQPVNLIEGDIYNLELAITSGEGAIQLSGAAIANEGAWDDPLPVRLDGYDAFGGIYRDFNFDMYEVDNPEKVARFLDILDQTDYILISSSREWASLPRLPQRFPMTTQYYRSLIGCPPERSIEWCYNVAETGMFQGELGFDLVKVFISNPTLGPWQINDQAAEEAFTVYDHPKVFIFKKNSTFDPLKVQNILGSVDLSHVNYGNDLKSASVPKDMMLPAGRLISQQEGGTWSQLFNSDALQNRFPAIGLVIWYIVVALLGLVSYPIVRIAMEGLPDKGYPLARTAGLLILSYIVWLAGSFSVPFSRLTISIVLVLMILLAGYLTYRQREALREEWRTRKKYFLLVEGLFLAFFVLDLLIRLGNPDLWHPWKGGEKPMDFSYFNAVLKSTSFPPFDPWFSGGYINYYYYGFVLVGVLVKWLGIVPAIAYNLILPTVFALIALGAFSVGWNLIQGKGVGVDRRIRTQPIQKLSLFSGLAGALGMVVLGNLGTLRMIYQGYQRLAAPGGVIENASILTRWVWAVRGFVQAILGTQLPYALADWYWLPSRVIPAPNEVEPITEFPFFTVLYGDPHAHLFALPLALLALSWAISVVFGRAWAPTKTGTNRRSYLQVGLSFLLGGMTIGALRPTNTWDLPTYLVLGAVALGYAVWRYYRRESGDSTSFFGLSVKAIRTLLVIGGITLLVGLAFLLYQPYAYWYVQGYKSIELWKGTHTPLWSYLTHWGLFLFVIVSWMVWETRQWMASTPLSSVRKLAPYWGLIMAGGVLSLVWVVVLVYVGVSIAWLVLPLAAWAGILILRPDMSDAKRVVLFMVGSGLVLTLMVEVVVLRGDVARMNTVFKFSLQAWTLFAVSAAAALVWLLIELADWLPGWRSAWQIALVGLVASAGLYPLLGATAKIKDRMASNAPHTLNGMAFMQYAVYNDLNTSLDLSQDYDGIRWMQENIQGSPTIVEGNMVEYHWATRYTIYTGLPDVIGWNWHQRQQRAAAPEDVVTDRINQVNEFYFTIDLNQARDFLRQFNVRYIVVGQLERALYPGLGLNKFEELNGSLWKLVYHEGETDIYEVLP